MAAEIDVSRGRAAAYFYKEPPWWHGGVVSHDVKLSRDVLRLAEMDFEVQQFPMFAQFRADNEIDEDTGLPSRPRLLATDAVANVRMDTRAVLGVVSERYTPVQNREAFEFMDGLIGSEIVIESAGSIRGGRMVWILARRPHTMQLAGHDPHALYVGFVNSHDGSMAMRVFPTSVRMQCMNTVRLALSRGEAEGLHIEHRGDISKKIATAKQVLTVCDYQMQAYGQIGEDLHSQEIARTDAEDYFQRILPVSDRLNAVTIRRREEAQRIMLAGFDSPDVFALAGTAWLAVQSATAWADHYSNRRLSGERRFHRCMMPGGQADRFKQMALAIGADRFLPSDSEGRRLAASLIERYTVADTV